MGPLGSYDTILLCQDPDRSEWGVCGTVGVVVPILTIEERRFA